MTNRYEELFKALERLVMPDDVYIKEIEKLGLRVGDDYNALRYALICLQKIDQAKSSDALKSIEVLSNCGLKNEEHCSISFTELAFYKELYTIKTAVLKLQKIEEIVNSYLLNQRGLMGSQQSQMCIYTLNEILELFTTGKSDE